MTRRILLVATAVLVVAGVATAIVVAAGDDSPGEPTAATGDGSSATTTSSEPAPTPGDRQPTETTAPPSSTPPDGGPVGARGATAVSGALLAEEFDGESVAPGEPPGCDGLGAGFDVDDCRVVTGSGGEFLVAAGSVEGGAREARLYRAAGDGRFEPVARTEAFERDVDVFGIALRDETVGGEAVVVVDYDFNGTGSVHSFDVVAWDEGTSAPAVVAFVEGSGQDRVTPGDGTLRFVSANYDDGAPTCCPEQADVRTLRRSAAGSWSLDSETVPIREAP